MGSEEVHKSSPRAKQGEIVRQLRSQIVSGLLQSGSQLPVREELMAQFSASSHTVQRALDRLNQEGFIHAKRRAGTFVAESPPHRFHYAMVFDLHPSNEAGAWSQFYALLCNEALELERLHPPLKIRPFFDISPHEDDEGYRTLLQMVRSHRLAGLIFSHTPFFLSGSQLLEMPKLPRVAISRSEHFPDLPKVVPDNLTLLRRGLEHLIRRGRRRIAIVSGGGLAAVLGVPMGEVRGAMLRLIGDMGGASYPQWIQLLDPRLPEGTYGCVSLLMQGTADQRPDALLLTDDHFVEPAALALAALGVHGADEVEVVAQCNFPAPPRSVLPVTYLGFDIRAMLEQCLEILAMQQRGESPPKRTISAPQFAAEWQMKQTQTNR